MESEVDKYRSKLIHLLENQELLEARILLKTIKNLNDVSEIVSTQWVPLATEDENTSFSSAVGLFTSDKILGYGSVLLHEVF